MEKKELLMTIAKDMWLHLLDYSTTNPLSVKSEKAKDGKTSLTGDLIDNAAAYVDQLSKNLAKTYDEL
jgi:hypothetical protein